MKKNAKVLAGQKSILGFLSNKPKGLLEQKSITEFVKKEAKVDLQNERTESPRGEKRKAKDEEVDDDDCVIVYSKIKVKDDANESWVEKIEICNVKETMSDAEKDKMMEEIVDRERKRPVKQLMERWKLRLPKVTVKDELSDLDDTCSDYFESAYDEDDDLVTLSAYEKMICQQAHLPSKVMKIVIQKMLLNACKYSEALNAHKFLMKVLKVHPPVTNRLRKWYLSSLERETDQKLWDWIGVVLQKLCNGNTFEERKENAKTESQDEDECDENTKEDDENLKDGDESKEAMFLNFLSLLLELDFASFINRCSKNLRKSLYSSHRPIVSQLLWSNFFGNFSFGPACKDLMKCLISSITNKVSQRITSNIFKLVSLMLDCLQLIQNNNFANIQPDTLVFIQELVTLCKNARLRENDLIILINFMNPSWAKITFLQMILEKSTKESFFNYFPLTLNHIVNHYMKLIPDGKPQKTKQISDESINESTKTLKNANRKGETELHTACIQNRVDEVKMLLSNASNLVNVPDNEGWTPIHEACNFGHVECVRELLNFKPRHFGENSVDLLAQSTEGITPLHDAVRNDHLEVARLLLEAGGKVLLKQRTKNNVSPIQVVKSKEMRDLLQEFESKDEQHVDIPKENMDSYVEIVRIMLTTYFVVNDLKNFLKDSPQQVEFVLKLSDCSNELLKRLKEDLKILQNIADHVNDFIVHVTSLNESNCFVYKTKMDAFLHLYNRQNNTCAADDQ